MYYLLLGDFGNVKLIRSNKDFDTIGSVEIFVENLLAIIFFIGATFVAQITILNMLIGIMSETLSKHNSSIDEATKRQRLLLQAEY